MSRVDVLTESAPERIWLQVDADGDAEDRSEPIMRESWGDMTWCAEEIGGQEVAYVRSDIVAELAAALSCLIDDVNDIRGVDVEGYAPGAFANARKAIAKATSP